MEQPQKAETHCTSSFVLSFLYPKVWEISKFKIWEINQKPKSLFSYKIRCFEFYLISQQPTLNARLYKEELCGSTH